MPFWKRLSPEEAQLRKLEQQEAETSRRSLKDGGLPLQAKRRLSEEVEADHALFTSDLSTNEFLLARMNMSRNLNAIGVVGMHIHSKRSVIAHERNDFKL